MILQKWEKCRAPAILTILKTYHFTDNSLDWHAREVFYRLRQVDYNGNEEYSNIVQLGLHEKSIFIPTLVHDALKIGLPEGAAYPVSLTLIDMNGKQTYFSFPRGVMSFA
jgi:hypothetical protein